MSADACTLVILPYIGNCASIFSLTSVLTPRAALRCAQTFSAYFLRVSLMRQETPLYDHVR